MRMANERKWYILPLRRNLTLGMLSTKFVHKKLGFCVASVKTPPEQTTLILDHGVEHAVENDRAVDRKQ